MTAFVSAVTQVHPRTRHVRALEKESRCTVGAACSQRRTTTRQASDVRMALVREERYSPNYWVKALVTLPKSRILRCISSHVIANTAVAALVFGLYEGFPDCELWQLDPVPFMIMSGFMGNLLGFRTNSAYERFWEGCTVWGSVMNRTRTLAVGVFSWLGPESDAAEPEMAHKLIKLLAAFPMSLSKHLRGIEEPSPVICELVPAEDWQRYVVARNRPLFILRLFSRYVAEVYTKHRGVRAGNTSAEREILERGITDLMNDMGMCERIAKTPVPLVYGEWTSRIIALWCLIWPVILVRHVGVFVVPTTAFVAGGLFSVEVIRNLIEDPFWVNPSVPCVTLKLENFANELFGDLQDIRSQIGEDFFAKRLADGAKDDGALQTEVEHILLWRPESLLRLRENVVEEQGAVVEVGETGNTRIIRGDTDTSNGSVQA
ncbi:UPF0187 protein [Porphyridium purpureum]|uniref:UPF0187 protein n=1 Tax=Porphyridium purpureum TaxID=35688 RepID=A0A5J4YS95_PORPP|nr:UPF0187 protein [Porphyridium purpureum]|eukprot:POR1835..scf236_6